MSTPRKVTVLTIVLAILAFLASPNGPFGAFWAPDPTLPAPSSSQLPLFILLNLAEVVMFGLGVSFLVFGYGSVKQLAPDSPVLSRLAHISIAWIMFNWWPHDSLHVHFGHNLDALLAIEYGFHITLMAAGVILAMFAMRAAKGRTTAVA